MEFCSVGLCSSEEAGSIDFDIVINDSPPTSMTPPITTQSLLNTRTILFLLVLPFLVGIHEGAIAQNPEEEAIRPYADNPYYWQYDGDPVLLLGGSWQDNLFNQPENLETHLDLLTESGGNYVRNTMSHRNEGNVFAFEKVDGKYDLDRFNDAYWQRFENFLRMTYERDIIVQIEVFDPWDYFEDHGAQGGWSKQPFNPANNVNYTAQKSGLPTAVDYAPDGSPSDHPFFSSVPEIDNNKLLLGYQQAFVDKMLSHSLDYPNVIYSIQNESGEKLAFGDYWAKYIHQHAQEAGRTVYVTDMRRNADLSASDHHHIYDQPERFNYLDVSQNSWTTGQDHYDQILFVREYISDAPRPINTVKIYNRDGEDVSVARFFRVLFAGGASARFHRPAYRNDPDAHSASTEWGLGLSPRAQTTIRSARMLADSFDIFASQPQNGLLSDRGADEAYALANPGRQYAVYFPDSGNVRLDVSATEKPLKLRWLNIDDGTWQDPQRVDNRERLTLQPPGQGDWAVVVEGR